MVLAGMEDATSFESYVEVLRHLHEPFLIASPNGRILAANAAAAEALGTSVARNPRKRAARLAFTSDPAGLDARLGVRAFPLRARDGRRYVGDASPLGAGLLLLRLSGGPEPTPRDRAFSEGIRGLRGITHGVSEEQTLSELSLALLTHGMTSVGALTGGIFLIDEAGTNLELKGSVGYRDESVERFRLVPLAAPIPLTDSVKQGVPVFLGTA